MGLAVAAAATPLVAWWGRPLASHVLWAEVIVVAFAVPYVLRLSFERAIETGSRVRWAAFTLAVIVIAAILVDFSLMQLRVGPAAARVIGDHLWNRYFAEDLHSGFHAGLLLLEGLLLLVAAQRIVSMDRAWGRRIAGAVVIGAAGAGTLNVYRLIAAAGRSDTFWRTLADYFGTIRLNEAFPDANAAGSFFVTALAVAIALASSAERAWRLVWITAAVAIACGLWISGSRVAILAGLVAAAASGLIALARKRIPMAAMAVAAAVAIVCAVAVLYLPARGTQKSSSIATEVRGGLARVAVRMIAERPLTGIGLSEFYRRSGEYASPELLALFPRARNENAHNNFLQIAAELGIVGLAAFVWVLVAVLSTARPESTQRLHAGLIVAIAAFLLTCLGGHPLLVHEAAYPFWILLGIAAAGPGPTETSPPSRTHRVVALATAAAIMLSVPARSAQQRRGADLEHVGIGVGTWQTADDGTRFRWARGSAVLFVPGTYAGFKVRLSAAANSPVRVQFKLDGRIANVITVTPDGWRNVTVVLPPDPTSARYRRLELTGTAEQGEDVQLMIGKVEPVGLPR